MNILIIENERPAADKLIMLLKKIDKTINVTGIAESVEDAINRIQMKPDPDLILMDIQLDDGLCFEIFETIQIDTPVIFTTAYDDYMLKAFKVNSIDYLLKPVDEKSLATAIKKFRKLYYDHKDPFRKDFSQLINEIRNQYKSRFLIKTGEKFVSVSVGDISHFHIIERNVFICDFQGKEYGIDYSLDQLQGMLDPRRFFRINRNCIININSISLMYSYSSSRLQLTLKNGTSGDEYIVSRERVSDFKKWVDK